MGMREERKNLDLERYIKLNFEGLSFICMESLHERIKKNRD